MTSYERMAAEAAVALSDLLGDKVSNVEISGEFDVEDHSIDLKNGLNISVGCDDTGISFLIVDTSEDKDGSYACMFCESMKEAVEAVNELS